MSNPNPVKDEEPSKVKIPHCSKCYRRLPASYGYICAQDHQTCFSCLDHLILQATRDIGNPDVFPPHCCEEMDPILSALDDSPDEWLQVIARISPPVAERWEAALGLYREMIRPDRFLDIVPTLTMERDGDPAGLPLELLQQEATHWLEDMKQDVPKLEASQHVLAQLETILQKITPNDASNVWDATAQWEQIAAPRDMTAHQDTSAPLKTAARSESTVHQDTPGRQDSTPAQQKLCEEQKSSDQEKSSDKVKTIPQKMAAYRPTTPPKCDHSKQNLTNLKIPKDTGKTTARCAFCPRIYTMFIIKCRTCGKQLCWYCKDGSSANDHQNKGKPTRQGNTTHHEETSAHQHNTICDHPKQKSDLVRIPEDIAWTFEGYQAPAIDGDTALCGLCGTVCTRLMLVCRTCRTLMCWACRDELDVATLPSSV